MESLPLIKKQVLIIFVFSILASIAAIIHGLFLDLNVQEIKRLTFEGFIVTLFVIFPAILFLEWVFDMNNEKRFEKLERKIKRR